MDQEEKEYEVESIIQARVVSEGRRGKKKSAWKYRVRWRGYGADDDTWEPVESFEGSEDIIDTFWGRAHTGGRDYHNIRAFKVGEEFLPMGPPRRKQKSPNDVDASREAESSKHSTIVISGPENEKRKRNAPTLDISEDRPNKRAREHGPVSALQQSPPPQDVAKGLTISERSKNKTSRLNVLDTGVATPEHSRRKRRSSMRASSLDEIVPASDGEVDDTSINAELSHPGDKTAAGLDGVLRQSRSNKLLGSSSQAITDYALSDDENLANMEEPDPYRDAMIEDNYINIPSHRARAANPLVKMVDPPSLPNVEKAISVKARLSKGNATLHPSASGTPPPRLGRSVRASGSRPGPGRSSTGFIAKKPPKNRSSILTAEKGTLKSMKGKYSKPINPESTKSEEDDIEEDSSLWGGDQGTKAGASHPYLQAPTAEELLNLAGLNAQNAEALPDFEEDPPSTIPTDQSMSQDIPVRSKELEQPSQGVTELGPLPQSQTDQVKTALKQSLDLAKDKLFPSRANDVLSSLSAAWKRSTIFGPLGLGSETQAKPFSGPFEPAQSASFFLNLDSSISIPVTLTPTSPSSSINLGMGQGGPSGKFYQLQPALSLLDTLRTSGSSARIDLDVNVTNEQRDHFQHFHSRLRSGDLFVAMAGAEVFAFCSAGNSLISQRLNLPPSLLGHPEDIFVSRVIIENYSAYADAALHADSRRWSQYISADNLFEV
ncbi:hypothetical protein BDZ94DRAFT_1255878 [Collybia nuda]|uniref:Chromo domain-containing protein n=1 Tax=Collybia nuda TaxID=64659 RepID=A0A9P6CJX8_9AGAR|nr:hypothetical protein BDZ94DRAFT_1255878 [Collybia nuda]